MAAPPGASRPSSVGTVPTSGIQSEARPAMREPAVTSLPPRVPQTVPVRPAPAEERSSSAPNSAVAILEDPMSGQPHGALVDFEPILDSICKSRPTLRAILGHAQLVRTGPGAVDLNVYNGSPFHQQQLKQKSIRDLINAEIARALGSGIRVVIHVKDSNASRLNSPSAGSRSPSAAPSDDPALSDHNLQEIMRRFDGEIVG